MVPNTSMNEDSSPQRHKTEFNLSVFPYSDIVSYLLVIEDCFSLIFLNDVIMIIMQAKHYNCQKCLGFPD